MPLVFSISTAFDTISDEVHGKIYWVMVNSKWIGSANLDGTGMEVLVNTDEPALGISVDPFAGHVYWSGLTRINRSRLDGSDVVSLITGLDRPRSIDLDLTAGHLYWANSSSSGMDGKLLRARLDGTGVETLFSNGLALYGVALDRVAGKVYWTDFNADKIQRANLDGTMVEDIIATGLDGPSSIALIPLPEPSCLLSLILGSMLLFKRRQ